MRLRVVLCHMRPSARSEGTASHTHHVRGSRHERAPTGRLLHEATPCGRTARLLLLSCGHVVPTLKTAMSRGDGDGY